VHALRDDGVARGRITRSRFGVGLMPRPPLTYSKVAAALVDKDAAVRQELAPVLPVLETLHEVYRSLRRHRERAARSTSRRPRSRCW